MAMESRFEYIHNGREVSLVASGDLGEVVAEVGYMVQRIYNGVKTQSPEAAVVFRQAMQSIMQDDAPTWEEPTTRAGETMIAMVQEH